MKKNKILIGMSGGIDSACAAYFLVQKGYSVAGAYMRMFQYDMSAENDARCAAESLNIPFHVIDAEKVFKEKVVDYFVSEYKKGRTPNPCAVCNSSIKFRLLLSKAREIGAEKIATGHYVRIKEREGFFYLQEAVDPKKDQSYFLFMLDQEILSHSVFPLSEHKKEDIKAIVAEKIPFVHKRKESQEICFISNDDYCQFLEKAGGLYSKEGIIRDTTGKEIGKHSGFFRYTIGQRRGIGIAAPYPLYVVKIDAGKNEIMVGSCEEALREEFFASGVHWTSNKEPLFPFNAQVRLRFNQKKKKALIDVKKEKLYVQMEEGDVVTPGQAVVVYDGDIVLGGGWIE